MARLAWFVLPLALVACDADGDFRGEDGAVAGTAGTSGQGGGQAAGGSAGKGQAGVSGAAGQGGAASGTSGAAGAPMVCSPGQSIACVGPSGCQGGQPCKSDGSGYEACDCGQAGASGSAGAGGAGAGGAGGAGQAGGGSGGGGSGGSQGGSSGEAGAGGQPVGGSSGQGGEAGAAGSAGAASCDCSPASLPLTQSPEGEKVQTGPVMSTYCPEGSHPSASPRICTLDFDTAGASLGISTLNGGGRKVDGTLVLRVQKMPASVPMGAVNVPMTISLGTLAGSDCVTSDYAVVKVNATFPPPSSPDGCSPLGDPTSFVATYQDADIHICGKCDIPVACAEWDAVVASEREAATNYWNRAIVAKLASFGSQASCLKQ
jgi:hypothetical protein